MSVSAVINGTAGEVAGVVGVRLERQAKYRNGRAANGAFERRQHFARHGALALLVDRGDSLDNAQLRAMIVGGLKQCGRIFGEARAAETRPGMEEFCADAIIEAHAARHLLHIGADAFAQIGDLVDEGDLGGEKRVGGVFDQFGGSPADVQDRRGVEVKRPVNFGEHRARLRVVGAHNNAVGMLEIANGRALAQKLGIRYDLYRQQRLQFAAGCARSHRRCRPGPSIW